MPRASSRRVGAATTGADPAERDAADTDARALPVVGLGIVLAGAPRPFAWPPWWAWLPVMLALAGLVLRLAWRSVSAYRVARRGQRRQGGTP